MDSGASSTIINKEFVKKLRTKRETSRQWTTPAGTFSTDEKCKISFTLPEFHAKKLIQYKVHVTKQPMGYDMIIGRDLLTGIRDNYRF